MKIATRKTPLLSIKTVPRFLVTFFLFILRRKEDLQRRKSGA